MIYTFMIIEFTNKMIDSSDGETVTNPPFKNSSYIILFEHNIWRIFSLQYVTVDLNRGRRSAHDA